MSFQNQAQYFLAQAEFADRQAVKAHDSQAKETWLKVAESCRHIAGLYRKMDRS